MNSNKITQDDKEILDKKRYLSRYRNNMFCIKRLESKLEIAKSKANSVRGSSFGERVSGGVRVPQDELYVEVIDLEHRIKSLKDKARNLKVKITEAIDTLDDVKVVEVMEMYYIDCQSFYDISNELNYSIRSIERLFVRGLKNIVVDTMS